MKPPIRLFHPLTLLVVWTLSTLTGPSVSRALAEPGDRSDDGVWVELESPTDASSPKARALDTDTYRVFEIDTGALARVLSRAPMEGEATGESLALPVADGSFQRFEISESPLLSPEMSAEKPDIRTYVGQGIDDPTAGVRLVESPAGFFAFIRTTDGMIFIEPFEVGDTRRCISYNKRDILTVPGVECLTEAPVEGARLDENETQSGSGTDAIRRNAPSGDELHTYQLGVTTTGEYTVNLDPGGGTTATDAEIVASVAAVNAIYVPEVAIRFMISCTRVYEDPDNDPFATTSAGVLNNTNQTILDSTEVCGTDNYDIGHVFHRRGSGFSGLASGNSCNSGSKAKGSSSVADPVSTTMLWVVDQLAHEIGHQFKAAHIFNSNVSGCDGGNRAASSAYEPGSGSTIMAYAAGARCDFDFPGTNDDYFHGHNFDQITNWRDGGGNCGVASASGNTPPEVDAGPDYTIPQGTPFTLTAVGSDADGHALTYCWEQFDLGDPPELPTNEEGPLFRSRPPVDDPFRTFPILSDILSGADTPVEILPLVDRELNFRCTVRDNRATAGGVNNDSMVITVEGDPFFIESPNGGETFIAGCDIPVTWTVGGGDVADNVDILFSDDGGENWVLVASNTPNDGAEDVTLPCTETEEARLMVQAVGNIFFDVSDDDFELTFPTLVVDADIDNQFDPSDPWAQNGLVIDTFEFTADVDLFDVRFSSDPLQCESVPCEVSAVKAISGHLVEFVPSVIGFVAAGEVVEVEIKTTVPVGQHACTYMGQAHVSAAPQCGCPPVLTADFDVTLEVLPIVDVDVDDNHGNVSDNVFHLRGAKNTSVGGTFTVVNPNSAVTNVDAADGPGNIRIEPVDLIFSDLVKVGDLAVTIPAGNLTFDPLTSLGSGEAQEVNLTISVPDGIPVNAFYQGTVEVVYESCLGGDVVGDSFAVELEVLKTQGTLDIVQESVSADFCPDDPWLMVGHVEFDFDIFANGDHRNVRISSGGLRHETLDKKLDDFNFFPNEFALIEAGETKPASVIVKIPIGQHTGVYSGYFRIVSENAGEDSVMASIDICPIYDLDIKDNYANLVANIMEIQAISRASQSGGEWKLRGFDIGVPGNPLSNTDEFDGPGNAPVDCIECEFGEWSPLWHEDDHDHHFHTNFTFTGVGDVEGESCSWDSGRFKQMLVSLFVPRMQGTRNGPGTYKGSLRCWAEVDGIEVASDFFDIEVQLARIVGPSGAPISAPTTYGGVPTGEGALLYWGDFSSLGLSGSVNLYRDDGSGEPELIASALDQESTYLDTEVTSDLVYSYRLGIGTDDDELMIGPLTVGATPRAYVLSQNAPNPFRSQTVIRYDLPSEGRVSLRIFDVGGRLVRTLVDDGVIAGYHASVWDRTDQKGRKVAGGVYYYRLKTPDYEASKKMVIMR